MAPGETLLDAEQQLGSSTTHVKERQTATCRSPSTSARQLSDAVVGGVKVLVQCFVRYGTCLLIRSDRTRWQITMRHAASLENFKKAVRSDGEENPCQAGLRSVCWKARTVCLKDCISWLTRLRYLSSSKAPRSRNGPGLWRTREVHIPRSESTS